MPIILKEAFRYQNFLDHLIGEAECYLRVTNNYMVVTEEHLRSKAIASAEDETTTNIADRPMAIKPDTVVSFLIKVYQEKEILSEAINNAKIQHCNKMDMQIALNKTRQGIVDSLKRMVRCKGNESIKKGCGYAINAEGNQIQYYYDVKQTSKIDFDKFAVKKIIQKLSAESDKVSTTADYWLSSIPVDYSPVFDINDSFEELVESYEVTMAN